MTRDQAIIRCEELLNAIPKLIETIDDALLYRDNAVEVSKLAQQFNLLDEFGRMCGWDIDAAVIEARYRYGKMCVNAGIKHW